MSIIILQWFSNEKSQKQQFKKTTDFTRKMTLV